MSRMPGRSMRAAGLAVLAALALAGCEPREEILPGERKAVREAAGALPVPVEVGPDGTVRADTAAAPEGRAFSAPPPQALAEWPQVRAGPEHHVAHAALDGGLGRVWSVDIGAGNDRRHRIASAPVVAGGRVFAMDARSHVTALSTDGRVLWRADLTPPGERNADVTGGGLAVGGGRLFATTGFGTIVALDPETGSEIWVQKTDAGVSAPPAYRDGIVYAVARNDQGWAVRAGDGRVLWTIAGTPSPSGFLGGAAPAVTERLVLLPFASDVLVAALRRGGVQVWAAGVAGRRAGRVYAEFGDITGDPVVADGVVYVGTQAGRTVALDLAGGGRLWTIEEGAYSPVWVAGASVFLVSDQGELLRVDRESGAVIWRAGLPYFKRENPRRRLAVHTNYGPVLAGGRLMVVSDDGLLRAFNPENGAPLGTLGLGGGAAADPVVAGGTLYVLTGDGRLSAFR